MGPISLISATEYAVIFVPKVKVEVMVPTSLVDRVDGIVKSGRTGQIGDNIFVAGIDRTMQIRTGENAPAEADCDGRPNWRQLNLALCLVV